MVTTNSFALFVGPTKSGTTWVHAYLEGRGDVALPIGMKETFFFDKLYDRGMSWYAGLFPDESDPRMRVEVAPSLFHKPEARARIAQDIPTAKIIVIVRDPFDRSVSHYFHYRKRGAPPMSLEEMARIYPDVVEAGLYGKHLPDWEHLFGEGQVYVMSYQLLRDDPAAFCRQLCEALNIAYIPPPDSLTSNQVNAAQVPRNLFLARVVQGSLTWLRRRGAQHLIDLLKRTQVKRWLYSKGGSIENERKQMKEQSVSFSETLRADWTAFQHSPYYPAQRNN